MNLFWQEAIERITKFAKIADKMGFEIALGFSGGKDSQVCYDLCKLAEIHFKAYYNEAFESNITKSFIREYYPDVIWRRNVVGFFENIRVNHSGYLPTVESAYCCSDYKHNAKFIDDCVITGVRRAESAKRRIRQTFEFKNKTTAKRNKEIVGEYFSDNCIGTGSASVITLKPIIDWTDDDIWDYIRFRNLPINPEYKDFNRVGCMICPKANFNSNATMLLRYPKLIDCVISSRDRSEHPHDWIITSENKDYSDNKVEYICRWLNHSFRPFTKKQQKMFEKVKEKYMTMKMIKISKKCLE